MVNDWFRLWLMTMVQAMVNDCGLGYLWLCFRPFVYDNGLCHS